MYFYCLMGCLKLTYIEQGPTLKVVYRKPTSDKKCVQKVVKGGSVGGKWCFYFPLCLLF